MKWNRSFTIILFIAVLCVLAYFLYPPNKIASSPSVQNIGKEHSAGSFKVQVVINPEQPKVGKNQLTIIIKDNNDHTISNAQIKAIAEMPAMGSMPTMYAPAEITNEQNGLYKGQLELPMMGAWPLTLTIDAKDHNPTQLSFDMGTSRKGLSLSSATPSTFSTPTNNQANSPAQPKTFKVDTYRRQLIGVTTDKVTCIDMVKTIHAHAKVSIDQTRLTDINLKFDGWIEQLNADYVGKQVILGEILFTVYSPELISSQDEYLHSYKRSLSGQSSFKAASAKRLSLWGINHTQIKALEKRGRSLEYLPILSPIAGTIIEKNIVSGSAFKAQTKLLQIADLSALWIEGQVDELDMPSIKLGMTAQIIVENQPDNPLLGKVTFIEPFLNSETRTTQIRVEVANPDNLLHPEQYVKLQLQAKLGERIVVPEQAVIFSGENRIVFVDLGEGQLQAKKIKIGIQNEGYIEVTDGLEHGETIVTSGNFLIASESKLKLGIEQW